MEEQESAHFISGKRLSHLKLSTLIFKGSRGSIYGNVRNLYESHEVYHSKKYYTFGFDLLYTLSHAKEKMQTHEHVTLIIKLLGMYLHPTAL